MLKLRLKKLREDKGLTQREVSDILKISDARYNQYETGKRTPDHEMLIELATFYNCSIDYLLGITDYPNITSNYSIQPKPKEEPETIKKTYENLKLKITDDENLSPEDKETLIGLINVSLTRLK